MSGHGHVTPNADGSKARCGGPAICSDCAIEAAQANLDAAADKPVRTEWNAEDRRYELILDGLKGDAKSMRYQARCEQTITGVRWVLTGALAKAVDIAAKHPIQTMAAKLEPAFITANYEGDKRFISIQVRDTEQLHAWHDAVLAIAKASPKGVR